MTRYQKALEQLQRNPQRWLVTGVAGFIGSHLLESLLTLGQTVCGMDNFSTGRKRNLDDVRARVGEDRWRRFSMNEADIRDATACRALATGADIVLHEAALGSVPRSIEDPVGSNDNNVSGFLNILMAARDCGARRFVYAASSSTYGDHPDLPKVEDRIGRPLSPYAVTKYVNELYADVFFRCYGVETIGLRYFNVFGPRQDPAGSYAAVIPRWIAAMMEGQPVYINGDGGTTRDFCYVENVVQANILAATTTESKAIGEVFNVAVSDSISLNDLFESLRVRLAPMYPSLEGGRPVYRDFRPGDVRHSRASIDKARQSLGFEPTHTLCQGLDESLSWYRDTLTTVG
jgi:UDP-N-acetylglucosamine 4-epimerase